MTISRSFLDKLIQKTGWDPIAVEQLLGAWQPYEGGGDKNSATYNPLNTTESMPGATSINSVGVKAYKSEDDGVAATIATLTNGRYPNIVQALSTGNIDAKKIAPDVRVWTSGSPTGGSNFADTLDGGGPVNGSANVGDVPHFAGDTPTGGAPTDPRASGTIDSGLQSRIAKLEGLIDAGYDAQPDPNDDIAYNAWVQKMQILNTSLTAAYAQAGRTDNNFTDRANAFQNDFNNRATTFDSGVKLDTLNTNNAVNDINRFLSGAAESRSRADLVLQAKEDMMKYGSPSGKTDFSYADLGAGFAQAAGRMGLSPEDNAIRYSGTTLLDPEGDMGRFDSQFGVSGQIPGIAPVQSQWGDIPTAGASPLPPTPRVSSGASFGGGSTGYDTGIDPLETVNGQPWWEQPGATMGLNSVAKPPVPWGPSGTIASALTPTPMVQPPPRGRLSDTLIRWGAQ